MSKRTCKNGHVFEKTNSCPVCPICSSKEMSEIYGKEFPKLAAPALRALKSIGITHLSQLKKYSEQDLLSLHGFGPNALIKLKAALKEKGWSFKK